MATRVPIIQLYENLIVSVQGDLDDGQAEQLREDVGRAISQKEPHGLILDVSSVDVLDSYLTRTLRDCAVAAHLMGVRTVVSGLSPATAITLVEMDLGIPGARTAMNLERALEILLDDAEANRGAESLSALFGDEVRA